MVFKTLFLKFLELKQNVTKDWPDVALVQDIATGAVSLGFDSRASETGHSIVNACYLCDVSSELCCPGAKPLKWARIMTT